MPRNKAYIDQEQLSLDTLSNVFTCCLRSDHEIQVLKYLFEKYNCRTISQEASSKGVQRQTVYNRIKSGEIATEKLNNVQFIIY